MVQSLLTTAAWGMKLYIFREWPGNAGSQSESMNCDFLGIVTKGFTIPETVFSKYIFVWKTCMVE